MILDKRARKKLFDELPYGSSTIIRDRIEKKHDILFTRQYVFAVLNPEDPRDNTIIIKEAVEYLRELRDRGKELSTQINNN